MRARPLIAVLFAIGFATALALSLQFTITAAAGGACEATYTVQRGDTLGDIARRLHTTVAELLRLNRGVIRDSDHIYAGQVLCVPAALVKNGGGTVGKEAENDMPLGCVKSAPVSQVAIEVTHQFTPTEDEILLDIIKSRGGFVGKRLVYPLQPCQPGFYITDTTQMQQRISGLPEPRLLLVRNPVSATYTLAFVGQSPPLPASLLITDTTFTHPDLFECRGADVTELLAITGTKTVAATLWLEAEDGLRFPFSVSRVSYMNDALDAADCYARSGVTVGLALVPTPSGQTNQQAGLYQAVVLLQDGLLGPGGNVRATNCTRWQGKRGLTYRWLRSFSRCGR